MRGAWRGGVPTVAATYPTSASASPVPRFRRAIQIETSGRMAAQACA